MKERNPNIEIINLIKENNKISTEKMALSLGVSIRTIKLMQEIAVIDYSKVA